jgi:hypothetical protein
MGAQAQNQAAKDANNRYRSVSEAALDSYYNQTQALNERGRQERAASSQQSLQNEIEGTQNEGGVRASAANRGVSGNSVDNLMQNFAAIEAQNERMIGRNLDFTLTQIDQEIEGVRSGAQSRIFQTPRERGASPFALALGIGEAAVGSYGSYLDRK